MTRAVFAIAVAAAMCGGVGVAQTPPATRDLPRVSLAPLTGRDSFDRYCASCHGTAGRGDGPVAASLTTRPADLTALARRNGNQFPRAQVLAYVDGTGRPLAAHGPTEMPLWGGIFRWLDTDARTKIRINNLVAYVESLQAPGEVEPARDTAALNGAQLFATYCAGCHGPAGRGDGAFGGQLRRDPPNLTQYQLRNRGAFPGDRLRRIIDGLEVVAHGNRTMPVWGDVFSRQPGGGRDASIARVNALVEFIRSIQERPAE
jgi:mono/diheme cytochrome c family protein